MQAAVVPAVSSSWQIKALPQPQPRTQSSAGEDAHGSICYADEVHDTLGHSPGHFPRIRGHEPVGDLVGVAPDVTTRR